MDMSAEKAAPGERWILRRRGKDFPVNDVSVLVDWAANGRVKETDFIFDPSTRRWTTVREVPQLAGAMKPIPKQPTIVGAVGLLFGMGFLVFGVASGRWLFGVLGAGFIVAGVLTQRAMRRRARS